MSICRNFALAAALALALSSTSCNLFHRSKNTTPPPPKPAPQPTVTAPPAPQPNEPKPESVPPPPLTPQQPDLKGQLPVQTPRLPPPPPKRSRRARRRTPEPAPAEQPPQPAETEADATPPAPVPQLEQILTPAQQAESNQSIDRCLGRAQRNLAALAGKKLTGGQTLSVERIKSFISQAVEARKTDLLLAKSLAERADVLSEDLLRSAQ